MTHHLSEKECDALRTALCARAAAVAAGSPHAHPFDTYHEAIKLLDAARSTSFRARLIKRYPPAPLL